MLSGSIPRTGIDRDVLTWVICPLLVVVSEVGLFVFLFRPFLAPVTCCVGVALFPALGTSALDFVCFFRPWLLLVAVFPEDDVGTVSWDFAGGALGCMWVE